MSESAAHDRDERLRRFRVRNEGLVAVAAFAAMCVVVLLKAPQLLEPDDFAYRASIVALSEGHLLLTNAQYLALQDQLTRHGGGGILQWTHLGNGKWISQKNPGYPFFAVIFQWLHALRAAPLFYGAFACGGLFYGARKWLGAWGGTVAVVLYCFSGAALIFAWRATMPTFSDASLIAGASGLLLGVLLARDEPHARRLFLGLVAFLALDGAVFIRYSDLTVLLVALLAVLVLQRVCSLNRSMLVTWCGAVLLFGVGDLALNHYLYGGYFTTGYSPGLVTFATSAILPNVERMPSRLIESMPMVVLALVASVVIAVRYVTTRSRPTSEKTVAPARRDGTVALVLVLGWLSVWGLYAMYTWTVNQTLFPGNPIHVVRFYVPAIGLIALLGTWLFMHVPWKFAVVLLVVVASLGLWSFHAPSNYETFHPSPPHIGTPPPPGFSLVSSGSPSSPQ
jgi:hypothetical protein